MSTGEGACPIHPYWEKAGGSQALACKPTTPRHSACTSLVILVPLRTAQPPEAPACHHGNAEREGLKPAGTFNLCQAKQGPSTTASPEHLCEEETCAPLGLPGMRQLTWDFSQGKSHPENLPLLQPPHRQSSAPSLSCSCPGPAALSPRAPTRSAPQTPHSSGSSGFLGLHSQCFCTPQPPLPWEDSSIPSQQT